MRECSSRNTVQILGEIDRNHESQLRKLLKNFGGNLLLNIWYIINCTERNYIYIYYIYPNAWKLLEFPALGDDLCICDLKLSIKLFKLIFPLSARKMTAIFPNFRKVPVLVWQILPFHCSFS